MSEGIRIWILITSLVCYSGCEQKPAAEADAFSGQTVYNRDQAVEIILTRSKNAPVAGEFALDGVVFDPSTRNEVELSSLWKRIPGILVFGSGSCTSSNLFNKDLNHLANRYEGKASFNLIYIREAHPEGGFQPMLQNDFANEEIPPIQDPSDLESRCQAALDFRKRKGLNLNFLVDDIDDPVAASWGAWPTRIFVVGSDGKILYAGDQGPWYFSVTKEGWHDPPPSFLESEFRKRPFDRISLEEFLETHFSDKT
ncbi:hypothetical protein OAM04_03375 [bacterium]|nr:hypothetical protein [Verrucomicrobiales bacterium]MDC0312241.1 hypothetical protein [bacterium]